MLLMGAAETRAIYIGDIITLEIGTHAFSAEQLREKFEAFEITELKRATHGYTISLRGFEPGVYVVSLGDKNLELHLRSTLQDIERDGLFEAEPWSMDAGFVFPWHLVLYLSAVVFVLSSAFVLIKFIIKKRTKPLSPMERFTKRMKGLTPGDENFLVTLTYYFKAYIGDKYHVLIVGKTSGEIIQELATIPSLDEMKQDTWEWLTACDRLKFSGGHVPNEEMERLHSALTDLVKRIEAREETV
jgi:uncharacterized protein CbrC (UPF0167 family)